MSVVRPAATTTPLRATVVAGTLALAVPHPAAAQRMSFEFAGTCARLVIGDRDVSAACAGRLTNAVSRDRTRFDFTTVDGTVLSFSGNGARQEATEATEALQPINAVTEGRSGAPALAVGACRFSTPEPGRTAIACEANGADGRAYAGTFITVGTPGTGRGDGAAR